MYLLILKSNKNQFLHPFNYKQCKCWSTHIILRKAQGNNRGAKHEFNNFVDIGTQRLNYWTETENKTFLLENGQLFIKKVEAAWPHCINKAIANNIVV